MSSKPPRQEGETTQSYLTNALSLMFHLPKLALAVSLMRRPAGRLTETGSIARLSTGSGSGGGHRNHRIRMTVTVITDTTTRMSLLDLVGGAEVAEEPDAGREAT